ncbi:hypothetical protein C8J36_103555 [Rhizobium sp. PP-F2F-G48]|uniref:DUF7768 domain-containing protein n=1 Tax=Rhizobium sp. PP-F2F-G48 TaxID=2135651 RepID=UPI0010E2D198|nr:hypothetical protein [Rhizobium sp. PP-F2F-G48]TCM56185.1 hypothetical protein C8J36_103555 [Rhizobium sp. PP-F2F-G48]
MKSDKIENAAKRIFAVMSFAGPVGAVRPFWIDGGSSAQQDEARRYAAAAINVETPLPQASGSWRLVILESPFAGDVEANQAYARAAMRDCLYRGEAPYASHLLYTQPGVLDDNDADQRRQGIEAGLTWGKMASATVVYTDRGISRGMHQGIERAQAERRLVEYRALSEGNK